MALIKCTECGHVVSDKASSCPHCGAPIPRVCEECGSLIPDNAFKCPNCGNPIVKNNSIKEFDKSKKNWWIVGLLIGLLCLIAGGGLYVYKSKTQDTNHNVTEVIPSDSILADGQYCYGGYWESKRHSAQPCKIVFSKKGETLNDCSYTNLKYDAKIPLNGIRDGLNLHFIGDIDGKQLVIDLRISPDGKHLIGEGVDYAHSGDKAKLHLNLNEIPTYDIKKEKQSELEAPIKENDNITISSSNTWAGASSMEELRRKLEGTTWHCDYKGIMKKFHFSNGGITMTSGRRGTWNDEHRYSSYKMEMHHLNNGNFVSVDFGEEGERMEYRSFSMAFTNKCMVAILFHFGEPVGDLIYGDYEWNDDL